MLTENEIWNKETMKRISSDVVSAEGDSQTINVSANKGSKPLYQNSIVKWLLVFGSASIMGVVIFLIFGSGGGKKSIANLQTEKAPEIAQEDQGGWQIAAQQGTANGMGIDVDEANPSDKKPDVAKLETADKPKVDAAKTTPVSPTTSPATGTTPAQAPVVPAAPPIATASKTTPVVYFPPKPVPIANTPANQDQTRKIGEQAAKIKELEQKVAKPEVKTVASLPSVQKGNVKPIEYKPTNPPVAPKPEPRPVVSSPVAVKPNPPVAVASNPTPAAAPISWEQASAASIYGDSSVTAPPIGGLGSEIKDFSKNSKQQRSNYEGALSPTLLLPAGTNAKGHTVAPYVAGGGKDQSNSTLSIALDEAIELASGYSFPVGTTINFDVSVRDNGSVVAISKNAAIGGVEIQIPDGAISLASADNGLLMTKEISTGGDELTRADIASSIWGGAAGAGRAILQGGSQTTTNTGLLGTTTQTSNGSPSIVGGIIDGAFTPLATNGQQRAQQTAARIQQRSRINMIEVNTKIKVFVNAPVQIQIPVSGQQVGTATEQEELPPPPRLITSNSAQLPANEESLPPPTQKASATQPSASASQAQQPSVVAPVKQSQPTITPLSLDPPRTRISRPW